MKEKAHCNVTIEIPRKWFYQHIVGNKLIVDYHSSTDIAFESDLPEPKYSWKFKYPGRMSTNVVLEDIK